ncbi:MAG: M23 family metallopeptidase [Chloroflexi bacterium]|nr:M23 family metallopeptidase [Chloroflexota bacterium]
MASALLLLIGLAVAASPTLPANAQLSMKFPFLSGAVWQVISGYNTANHTGYTRYSFDMVRVDGQQAGKPVLAAAQGTYVEWYAPSGIVILQHSEAYFTMYTHLATRAFFPEGASIKQGQILGTVGNTGAPWAPPHIHFTLFQLQNPEKGIWDSVWLPVPFLDLDGRTFPADDNVVNQYFGITMTSSNSPLPPQFPVVGQALLPLVSRRDPGFGIARIPSEKEDSVSEAIAERLRATFD